MAALCNALQSGDPVRGYATTTSAYQHETIEQKFAARNPARFLDTGACHVVAVFNCSLRFLACS
jgi:hypothetical protein